MRQSDFDRLWREHSEALYAFLVYRCGDRTLAEDVLADTFERAFRARTRFDPRKSREKTWLYSIALNRMRDQMRRHDAERRSLERVGAPAADATDAALRAIEARDELGRALETLTPEEREAISLRFGAELTVPEIARVTKQSRTTAEGRVYRALRKLRAELEPGEDD